MHLAKFKINGNQYEVSTKGSPEFNFGKDEFLSLKETDVVYDQPWYEKGFAAIDFLNQDEFTNLKSGLTEAVKRIIDKNLEVDTTGFTLEKYHQYVVSQEDHMKIVSRTRDLFSEDFNFPIQEMMPKFEQKLGFSLSDLDPRTGEKLHIIVRINRPKSNDYNPPHKDIYEEVDKNNYLLPLVNLWIPIAGVTQKSSLPVVPGSHKLNENQILRTFDGGVAEGNTYRVRMVKEWGGKTEMQRAEVTYGQVLFFTPHLIHGLAVNDEDDMTRVALEFRLFKI